MNTQQLTANAKFIFSSFGSFLVSRWATKTYGPSIKFLGAYGELALATSISVSAITTAKKIPDAQVGLGMIAGTGMNAAWSLASVPTIKEKLPQSIQATLGDEVGESMQGNSLDGYSDHELMGNERVISIARDMAEHEKETYLKALISAAKQKQILIPAETMGSGVLQTTFNTGLEGEVEEDLDGDGNSLDS